MQRFQSKRFAAFLIDMLLVSLVAVTLGNLSYLNPTKEEYEKATEEYNMVMDEYVNSMLSNSSSSFPDTKSLVEYGETSIMPTFYKVERNYFYYGLWYLIIYFLYFCLFAYFNNGQTLGKKLFKIKIVNKGEDKVSFIRLIIRSLFNGTSFYYGINLILLLRLISVLFVKSDVYFYLYSFYTIIGFIIEVSLLLTLVINKGKRLTNDYLAKTEVIEDK